MVPRARDPAREKAYEIYAGSGGKSSLVEIAELLELPAATVRSWKTKDKWEQRLHGKPAAAKKPAKKDRSAPKKRSEKSSAPNVTSDSATVPSGPISDDDIQAEVEQLIANDRLTDKQRLFCAHYIRCFSPQKAARAAGYAPKYANRIGWQLLQKAPVKAEVDRLRAQKLTAAMLSADDVFERMIAVATADLGDFAKIGSGSMAMRRPGEYDGSLIKKIKMTDTGMSLELHDQQRAWEWLADHMDLMSTAQRQQYELARDRLELDRQRLELERQKAGNDAEVEDLDDVDEEIYGQEKENDPV